MIKESTKVPVRGLRDIKTLGELKASGYQPKSIKEETRAEMVSNHL